MNPISGHLNGRRAIPESRPYAAAEVTRRTQVHGQFRLLTPAVPGLAARERGILSWAVVLFLAITLNFALTGCKRADARGGGAPITGKASDPPVTFVPRWDETNAFVYHLETITGTQVPRRNSSAVIQQDTVLAKDLRFGITNFTREGVRAMSMEVQAVRVETTSDQRLTGAFDTENEMISSEDSSIANRLRRVKGARLGFKLAPVPSVKVVRVDGTKEFNDRVGANRNVKGAAGAVLNRFFNPQFYRDLVEMTFLPTNPVRVGDSWVVRQRSGPGLYDNNGADLTYTFRGWQVREGTNCARIDFAGDTKSGAPANRRSGEEAAIEGAIWFSQDLGVPVELDYSQSLVRQSSSTRTVRIAGGTNAGSGSMTVTGGPSRSDTNRQNLVVEIDEDADSPAPPPPPNSPTNASGRPAAPPDAVTTTTSRTTTSKQQVTLTLVEIVPVETPPGSPLSLNAGSSNPSNSPQ